MKITSYLFFLTVIFHKKSYINFLFNIVKQYYALFEHFVGWYFVFRFYKTSDIIFYIITLSFIFVN